MTRSTLGPAAILLASCLTAAPGHAYQAPPAPTQPLDERTLSLDDLATLDALLEAESEAHRPLLEPGMVIDIAGLGLVLALAVVSFVRKSERLKIITLVLSVAYLGFFKASLVSIVDIFGAIQRSLPAFTYAVPYYLLIGFTVVSTVLWGRLYCGRVCAFGALTQLLDKLVPARYRVELPPWLDRRAMNLKYVILVAVILYVLSGGDTLVYRYLEPFWMFTLSGNTTMWALLAILLVATASSAGTNARRAKCARRLATGVRFRGRRSRCPSAYVATTANDCTKTRRCVRTGSSSTAGPAPEPPPIHQPDPRPRRSTCSTANRDQ